MIKKILSIGFIVILIMFAGFLYKEPASYYEMKIGYNTSDYPLPCDIMSFEIISMLDNNVVDTNRVEASFGDYNTLGLGIDMICINEYCNCISERSKTIQLGNKVDKIIVQITDVETPNMYIYLDSKNGIEIPMNEDGDITTIEIYPENIIDKYLSKELNYTIT